jgi:hypothetical protein
VRELLGSNSAGIFNFKQIFMKQTIEFDMPNCSVCGQQFEDDIRFLNHMMEKHGFRNPNIDKPDRNSRGY